MIRAFRVAGLAAALTLTTTAALAAPGSLDKGFSGDGKLALIGQGSDHVTDWVTLSDGTTFTVGVNESDPRLVVRKITPKGKLDKAFSGDGVSRFGTAGGQGNLLARDPRTGKLSVMAWNDDGSATWDVYRLTAKGRLDKTFSGDGKVHHTDLYPTAFASQPDGRLLVAGYTLGSSLVTRLKLNGGIDSSFGADGLAPLADGFDPSDLVPLENRSILVGGSGLADLRAMKLTPGGEVVTGFGTASVATYLPPDEGPLASTSVWPPSVAVRPNGSFLMVAGDNYIGGGGQRYLVVVSFTKNGRVSPSFGNGARTNLSATFGGGVALQPNGKIVIAASTDTSLGSGVDTAAVVRLLPSGTLDPKLSGDGILPVGQGSQAYEVAVLRNGRIQALTPLAGSTLITRYLGDKVPKCSGRYATIVGSKFDDILVGTTGPDVIAGLASKDTLKGRAGDDRLCGGKGPDLLIGGPGQDILVQ